MATVQEILTDMTNDRDQKQQETRARILKEHLDALRAKGFTNLSFCTNPMLSRGMVYHCRLQEDDTAIIEFIEHWWAMSYSEPDYTRRDQVLGKIEANFGLHNKIQSLRCQGLQEGRG